MVWLVLTAMTAAAVLCVAWPLLRPMRLEAAGASELAFYRDQLHALDAEIDRGLVRAADAEATRAELGRRLLAAADRRVEAAPAARRRLVAAVSAAAVVLVPAVLYPAIGRPMLPDAPLATRETGQDGFAIALARMEAHLAADPNDGRGFALIAPLYMRLGRFDDAARAFAAVVRTLGPTPQRLVDLGQARVLAADGVVTDDARKAFDDALAADPTFAEARFFQGLAALQDGDKAKARALWTAVVDAAPPGATYVATVRARIAELDGVAAPEPPVAPAAGVPAGGGAIAALPADQQRVAIRGMVDGLAARLARDGHDPDGWLKLVRAYGVLGEPDLARKALTDARRSVGGDPAVAGRLDALAHELGLEG